MKTMGIFEAKTCFSQLCDTIAASGSPVLVQRRGKPLVLITPPPAEQNLERDDIYTAWKHWQKKEDEDAPEFPEVWKMRTDKGSVPF